jgi:Dolichyl-phosphate-mannose-protein mannosyltransferase
MQNRAAIAVCLALLALFAARADHFARSASQTFDEGAHLVAGVSYWRTGDFRLNAEHPPLLKLLWTLPIALRSDVPFEPDADAWEHRDHWRAADAFLSEGPVDHFELLLAARRVNIVLGAFLIAAIAWWGFRLWGAGAGVLACTLAAMDPNLAAFAALLSMDLGLALFATVTAYALWEFAGNGSRPWFYLAGVTLGLALASKFSAVLTVSGLGAGAVVYALAGGQFGVPGTPSAKTSAHRVRAGFGAFVRLGLVAATVVAIAYGGIHMLDWAAGLKQQMVRKQHGDPRYFLDGAISSAGWWRYFPEVLAIKVPPAILLLATVSIAGFALGRRLTRRDMAFLVSPAVIYTVFVAASRIDIGFRVLLPAYPMLMLLAARTITLVAPTGVARTVGLAAIVATVVPGVIEVRHLGKELSYANGLGAERNNLHERLGDSNIDWGQGLKSLKAELAARGDPVIYFSYAGTARPEAYGIRHVRLPGWGQIHTPSAAKIDPNGPILVAVSVSNLQGTYLQNVALYRWLRGREPMSRTDDSIWLFDVTGDVDALKRLSALTGRER